MKKAVLFITIFFGVVLMILFAYSMWPASNFSQETQVPPLYPEYVVEEKDLYGDWEWIVAVDAAGVEVAPPQGTQFVLSLFSDGRLKSTTDCNELSGSFIRNADVLGIGFLSSTEKICQGTVLESAYGTQLSRATSFSIEQDRLILNLAQEAGTMVFKRKEKID